VAVSRSEVLPVGPPVSARWQIGREGDIARLVGDLLQGTHVVLADRRRSGKTTVALAALDQLALSEQNPIVAIDLSRGVRNGHDFDERIARQVAAQRSAMRKAVSQASGIATKLWRFAGDSGLLDGDDTSITDALDALRAESERQSVGWALDAALALATRQGGRAIVFVDEAQRIDDWEDREIAAAEIRARMRTPTRPITFLFAGSEPSLIRTLFAHGGLLEYDALDFDLSPIDFQPWREGLRRAFRELNLEITDLAMDLILEATQGQPHRTMLVANRAAEQAEFAEQVIADEAVVAVALAEARSSRLWEIEP
jgi:DNA polymerase III delta prime subunit